MDITESLKPGATGPDVKRLQEELKAIGYDPGAIDGKYGASTEAAVRKFQKDRGLTEDGVVGPETARAINALFDQAKKPPAGPATPAETPPTKPQPKPAPSVSPADLDLLTKINEALEKLKGKLSKEQLESTRSSRSARQSSCSARWRRSSIRSPAGSRRSRRPARARQPTDSTRRRPLASRRTRTSSSRCRAPGCAADGWSSPWTTEPLRPCQWATSDPENGGGTKTERQKFDDPYWEEGARPQAESGKDKRERTTNGAGIDISQHLWEQLGLDPKGGHTVVRWRFVDRPADGQVDIRRSDGQNLKHKNKGS